MKDPIETNEQNLLDYHLDQLGPEEADRVKQAILQDGEAARCHKKLSSVLEPLDGWQLPPPPKHLVEDVLDRVGASRNINFAEAASALPPGAEGKLSVSPLLSLRELIAVAACIMFFVGVFVPGFQRARGMAQRTVCANNLGDVLSGVHRYAYANANQLPYAGMTDGASWLPVKTPGVQRTSNGRNRYLLLKLKFVGDPKSFVCPSRKDDIVMGAGDVQCFDDFPQPENCSYVSQNMLGGSPRPGDRPGMAFMADANPLFDGGRINCKIDPRTSNSSSHGHGAGQNIALLDGSTVWAKTPVYGPPVDNIWLAGERLLYTGTEAPECTTDSFLVP